MNGLVAVKLVVVGLIASACIPATFEEEFGNSVGSIPVGGNNPSIGR